MQENPESQEKKVTKGHFFEAPEVPKAKSEEEPCARHEGKTGEEVSGTAPLEREESKKSEFKPESSMSHQQTRFGSLFSFQNKFIRRLSMNSQNAFIA